MLQRMGFFFIFIGVIIFVLYALSEAAQTPVYPLLLAALACTGLGIYWWRKGYTPPAPSNRFSLLRKLTTRQPKNKPPAKK